MALSGTLRKIRKRAVGLPKPCPSPEHRHCRRPLVGLVKGGNQAPNPLVIPQLEACAQLYHGPDNPPRGRSLARSRRFRLPGSGTGRPLPQQHAQLLEDAVSRPSPCRRRPGRRVSIQVSWRIMLQSAIEGPCLWVSGWSVSSRAGGHDRGQRGRMVDQSEPADRGSFTSSPIMRITREPR